jgi:hypothetical protein
MIADRGTLKFSGKCHIININMWQYLLDRPMIAIQMGDVDVLLGF